MNELAATIDNRIREYLSADTDIHYYIDYATRQGLSFQEIIRKCDLSNKDDCITTNRFLVYTWCNLGAHADAFHSLINEEDFLKIKEYPIDYKKILKSTSSKIRLDNPKFNIIVPVRNRKDNLDCFIANAMRIMRGKKDWAITVIFQEEDDKSYHEYTSNDYPSDLNLNFINIRNNDWFVSNYGDNMNKSLCYNIASLMVHCEYQVNHDIDLIFGNDFLENIESKTSNKNFKWLQPYRGSRVNMLDEHESQTIKDCLLNGVDFTFPYKGNQLRKTPFEVGAPGGSIVVRHSDFIEIGGYDPEIVWGYAPEDALFWYKLEAKYGCVKHERKKHPFCSTDVFSHETQVEVYHLYHEPTPSDKRYPFFSTFVVDWLMNKGTRMLLDKWLDMSKEKMRII